MLRSKCSSITKSSKIFVVSLWHWFQRVHPHNQPWGTKCEHDLQADFCAQSTRCHMGTTYNYRLVATLPVPQLGLLIFVLDNYVLDLSCSFYILLLRSMAKFIGQNIIRIKTYIRIEGNYEGQMTCITRWLSQLALILVVINLPQL